MIHQLIGAIRGVRWGRCGVAGPGEFSAWSHEVTCVACQGDLTAWTDFFAAEKEAGKKKK